MSMPGGLTYARPVDSEARKIALQVRSSAQQNLGRSFDTYVPISYKTQVVAGVNYFIKIKVGPSDYIHVRIFQSLPYDGSRIELVAVQDGHTESDDISYF